MRRILTHCVYRNYQRSSMGSTLTEMVIVLGIIALILGAVWVAGGAFFAKNKIRVTTQQLETISHNMRTVFAEQGGVTDTGGGALTIALDRLAAFPIDMRQNQATPAGILFNVWSTQANQGLGSVLIDSDDCYGHADITGSAQPCFGVTFYQVPQDACILLLGETSQPNLGLQQIQVNSQIAGDARGGAFPPLPIPASSASGDCDSGSNDILWTYVVKGDGG